MIRLGHGCQREGMNALVVPVLCSLLLFHRRLMESLDLLTRLLRRADIQGESSTVAEAIAELLRVSRVCLTGVERFRSIDGWAEHCLLVDRGAKGCA